MPVSAGPQALNILADGSVVTAADAVDDAAVTLGTQRVNLLGAVADETAPDSVDEGDAGAVRMSLDRKLMTAGTYVDDTAFTPAGANSHVQAMAALADETASDSVDEGDVGVLRMTLDRKLITAGADLDGSIVTSNVSYGRRIAAYCSATARAITDGRLGILWADLEAVLFTRERYVAQAEDNTNAVIAVVQRPLTVSTYGGSTDQSAALEASSISKASAGNLYRAFGVIDKTAPTGMYYVQLLNSATLPVDGAVTHLVTPVPVNHISGTDSTFDTDILHFGCYASAGIVIVLSTALVTKAIAGAYLFATVRYY